MSSKPSLDDLLSDPFERITRDGDGKVRCALTGDDWQLYTRSMDCSEAVACLNAAVESACNEGGDLAAAVHAAQDSLSGYGAADSEGRRFAADLVEHLTAPQHSFRH